MHKTIKRFAIGWSAVFLFTVTCYTLTHLGIAPTWVTWYLGLFSTIVLLLISAFASLGFLAWIARPGNIWTLASDDAEARAPIPTGEMRKAA